jgi:hypothetical protein
MCYLSRLRHLLQITSSTMTSVSSYHHIIISSYHHIIISSYHHIIVLINCYTYTYICTHNYTCTLHLGYPIDCHDCYPVNTPNVYIHLLAMQKRIHGHRHTKTHQSCSPSRALRLLPSPPANSPTRRFHQHIILDPFAILRIPSFDVFLPLPRPLSPSLGQQFP